MRITVEKSQWFKGEFEITFYYGIYWRRFYLSKKGIKMTRKYRLAG